MNKFSSIVFICATLLIPTLIQAEGLNLSLNNQMKKQDQLNKRNTITQKLTEKARVKQEAKERIDAQKYKSLTIKNKILESKNTITQAKDLTPQLTIPPVPPQLIPTINTPRVINSSVSSTILNTAISYPKNVDINQVINTWLSWTNSVRQEQGLSLYSIDTRLNGTAAEWSEYSKNRGYIIHGRPGDGCVGIGNYTCYNFSAIDSWFKDRGIDPIVINRAKHTENIGTRWYSCSSSDCTNEMIVAIRKTFDFFLSEKNYNGVHYRSLVNPVFTKIGVGVTVDDSKWVYYLTVHYITK